jgi:hypothetical protein
MANKALPLLILGGGALLLLGGKKKKGGGRSCVKLKTPEQISDYLHNEKVIKFPAAVIVYPPGGRAHAERLCDQIAGAGAGTVVMGHEEAWKLLNWIAKQSGVSVPAYAADNPIKNPGVAVFIDTDSDHRYTPWNDIPWENPKTLLAK